MSLADQNTFSFARVLKVMYRDRLNIVQQSAHCSMEPVSIFVNNKLEVKGFLSKIFIAPWFMPVVINRGYSQERINLDKININPFYVNTLCTGMLLENEQVIDIFDSTIRPLEHGKDKNLTLLVNHSLSIFNG
ncbi:hypothetical protein C9426_09375 [Serratia sp. S1B]|nr:hypothetical protein C9426_09375 [Serratia sp. S1B]